MHGTFCECGQQCYEIPIELFDKLFGSTPPEPGELEDIGELQIANANLQSQLEETRQRGKEEGYTLAICDIEAFVSGVGFKQLAHRIRIGEMIGCGADEVLDRRISFDEFNKMNTARCTDVYHPIDQWSPTDWGCALAGEVGEMLNLVKKLKRGEDIPLPDLANEAGDIVAYLDLLCTRLGFSLGLAAVEKFNIVSKRLNSKYLFVGYTK